MHARGADALADCPRAGTLPHPRRTYDGSEGPTDVHKETGQCYITRGLRISILHTRRIKMTRRWQFKQAKATMLQLLGDERLMFFEPSSGNELDSLLYFIHNLKNIFSAYTCA